MRSYLATQEALRLTDFEVTCKQPKSPDAVLSVTFKALDHGSQKWLDVVKIVRPPPKVFEAQLAKVLDWAELREERAAEILGQIDNQYPFWGSLIPIQSDRLRHTRELLDAAVQMSIFVEMRFKHELACWRPCDYSSQVQPMITTPGHGSLPCGHCTQSRVIVEVLKGLLNSMHHGEPYQSFNRQLGRMADRISVNRLIAGVHFPVDNVAGRLLGTVLGEYFVYRCEGRPTKDAPKLAPWHAGKFDGTKFPGDADFDPFRQPLIPGDKNMPDFYKFALPTDEHNKPVKVGPPQASLLSELWKKAEHECRDLRLVFDPNESTP